MHSRTQINTLYYTYSLPYTSRQISRSLSILVLALLLWALALPLAAALPHLAEAFGNISGDEGPAPAPQNYSVGTPSAPANNQSNRAGASFNWSGYAAHGTYTGVSGSWSVPRVTSGASAVASEATWVGIGGITHTDL